MTFFTQENRVGAWVLHPPGFLFMFSGNVQAVGDVSICRGRVSRPVFPNLHRVSIYTIPVALSSWRTTGGVCEKSAGRDVLRTSKPVPYRLHVPGKPFPTYTHVTRCGRAGCLQPAGFISQTDDENVSVRVFAGLFSVLCTDSIPGTPAVSTFIYM